MRFGVRPDNLVERILIALHLVPTPLLDSFGMVGARALLVATRIGVFDALVAGALTADQVAARLGTHPDTTRKLPNFLVPAVHSASSPRTICGSPTAATRCPGPAGNGCRRPAPARCTIRS